MTFATESDIYYDERNVFKIYKGLGIKDLFDKKKKINMLMKIEDIPNVILPNDIILRDRKNGICSGYKMDYIDGFALYDYFSYYDDKYLLASIIHQVSNTLRNIHDKDIAVTDLSFDNIHIRSSDLMPFFIDFDGCSIGNIIGGNISILLYNFLYQYRFLPMRDFKNRDRLSLILSTVQLLFNLPLENLDSYQIDKGLEKYPEFLELSKIMKRLIDKNKDIGEIPYLDEVINVKRIGTF